jgi:predicted permease
VTFRKILIWGRKGVMKFPAWRRRRRQEELEEEIQRHLEMAARDRIERGEIPDKARADARREFGNVGLVKEATRAAWGWVWLEQLGQDLGYALRMVGRSPGFTTVAVLSLGLAIGANTAIFSVIDALMLRMLPVECPEQLVNFREHLPGGRVIDLFAYEEIERFRELTQVFSGVSAICLLDRSGVAVTGPGAGPDAAQVRVALVSGDYFSMLGARAAVGRILTPDDDRVPDGHPVAMISDDYWAHRLNRAADVLERALTLNGTTYTILGVMPAGFSGDWVGRPTDIWIPMMMQSDVMVERPGLVMNRDDHSAYWLRLVGRLKPGVSSQQAQAAARVVQQQFQRDCAGPNPTPRTLQDIEERRLDLEPGSRGYSPQRESFAQSLAILSTIVWLVLLIACANLAGLLLARSSAREREMALRLALGARTGRLVRQLLTESVLLAAMGGAFGLVFAAWTSNALAEGVASGPVSLDPGVPSGVSFNLQLNSRPLVLTAGVCFLTGILFGLAPALRGSKTALAARLTGRSASGISEGLGGGRLRLPKLLVVGQVALSLVVLVGAGLFVRTLRRLRSQDLGFERNHVLLVWTLPGVTGRHGPALGELWHAVQERLSALPGVTSVSASNRGLLDGHTTANTTALRIEGQNPVDIGIPGAWSYVAPGFFETMGIPLVAGHDLTDRDNGTATPVVIINESMARYYFGDQNPIGRRVGYPFDTGTPREIAGVVKDFVDDSPRQSRRGMSYFPYRDRSATDPRIGGMCVGVRAGGDPLAVAATVRRELQDLDPSLPVLKIDTVDQQLDDVLAQERLIAALSCFFGAITALLGCLGLYGVVSYGVERRTNEIGIRMAMGATRAGVLGMVLSESMLLVLAGLAIGLPAALAATRLISSRLYGVSAADPLTIVDAILLMVAVAALAGFIPARRASKVDPMVALRFE